MSNNSEIPKFISFIVAMFWFATLLLYLIVSFHNEKIPEKKEDIIRADQ